MGRLGGFRYREIVARLRRAGFQFERQASGSHELWFNPATQRRTLLSCHPGEVPEGTLRAILRQTGISPEEFLRLGHGKSNGVYETDLMPAYRADHAVLQREVMAHPS